MRRIPVELVALVHDVVELCRPEAQRAETTVAFQPPASGGIVVNADPIQIQQVLVNLVQNAIHALAGTPSRERRLILQIVPLAETAQIDVIDNGPGIGDSDTDELFAPFHTTKSDGLGIGLSICRSIVEQHHGTIWRSRLRHEGPSFRSSSRESNFMPPTTTDKPTVFVVADDQQMRESLCVLLEMLGFQVNAFATPGSFARDYEPEMAGCLLLDIRMPRQSGLELYEQMLREGKRLPVIFITAHADVSTAVAAMKTGAIEFLEKPFERATLLDSVEKALALDAQWRKRDAEFAALAERVDRLNPRDRETLALSNPGQRTRPWRRSFI